MDNSEFIQLYLSEQAKTMDHLALLVAITVAVVTVVFALGAFLVWKENRSVFSRVKEELDSVKDRRKVIDRWFEERRASISKEVDQRLRLFEIQLEQLRSVQTIRGAIDRCELHPAIIFPALSFLAEHPSPLYISLFKEIQGLRITEDITERAGLGLRKLQNVHRTPGNG